MSSDSVNAVDVSMVSHASTNVNAPVNHAYPDQDAFAEYRRIRDEPPASKWNWVKTLFRSKAKD